MPSNGLRLQARWWLRDLQAGRKPQTQASNPNILDSSTRSAVRPAGLSVHGRSPSSNASLKTSHPRLLKVKLREMEDSMRASLAGPFCRGSPNSRTRPDRKVTHVVWILDLVEPSCTSDWHAPDQDGTFVAKGSDKACCSQFGGRCNLFLSFRCV